MPNEPAKDGPHGNPLPQLSLTSVEFLFVDMQASLPPRLPLHCSLSGLRSHVPLLLPCCNTARTSTEPFCHCRGCRLLVDGAGRAQTSEWRSSTKAAHICLGASTLLALRFRSYFAPSFSFAAAVPSCVVCASRSSVGTLVCASRGCFFGMPCQQPI